ncbi:hypothetical protein GCM10010193_19480 [Kitasatospora atroaurantiaca]|uniref:Uncharacterized protein n=1 Tax=Kitasatospora atroaurantiaca TaxID=285545 RepID=A0A561EPI9_9ACTN|nr:hypothetical protein [Kitasatospora atroaurantiaca]TWE17536.1 hypothetical protein FB465_2568 [Kitasatospora atroaurantiaca]
MTRPTIAQFCTGTLTVVATTVALLAVSGATEVFEIMVLVAFAVALGTLATALLITATQRRSTPRPSTLSPTSSAAPQPEYARQH